MSEDIQEYEIREDLKLIMREYPLINVDIE